MTAQSTSPDSAELGYTGCEIYQAKRLQRNHAVKTVGSLLKLDEAIAERKAGRDVVVCGPVLRTNIQIAEKVEAAATGNRHQLHRAHLDRGKKALSHWQHETIQDSGHTFFESPPERMALYGHLTS
ncbi:MAG: hypothetical protein ACKVT0_00970 [Planctomycetaceae bacterium]